MTRRGVTAAFSSFSSMSLPTLPAEIHELIIDFVAKLCHQERKKALSTCALVCSFWHSSTLRHTFREFDFPNIGRSRPDNTLHLMERNGNIGRCFKSIEIFISAISERIGHPYTDSEFETFCRHVSRGVVRLVLVGEQPSSTVRPILHSALSLLLKSPTLRHLRFSYPTFRTSFLEGMSDLETLSLGNVYQVDLGHQDGSKLASFNKLEFLFPALQPLVDAMNNSADFCRLFARVQHFLVSARHIDLEDTKFGYLEGLRRARSCRVLDLHFWYLSCKSSYVCFHVVNHPLMFHSVGSSSRCGIF